MARKPNHLVPPCGRSGKDRIEWLRGICQRRGGRQYEIPTSSGPWLFCWNVKLHRLDLSFENLLKRGIEIEAVEATDEEHIELGRKRLEGTQDASLWTWAVADAQQAFVEDRRGVPGDCAYTTLWNGDNVRAEYQFMGRGGGWLVMTYFLGLELSDQLHLESLPYRQIRALSEMVWFVTHSLKNRGPERAVEEAAAWIIFNQL